MSIRETRELSVSQDSMSLLSCYVPSLYCLCCFIFLILSVLFHIALPYLHPGPLQEMVKRRLTPVNGQFHFTQVAAILSQVGRILPLLGEDRGAVPGTCQGGDTQSVERGSVWVHHGMHRERSTGCKI